MKNIYEILENNNFKFSKETSKSIRFENIRNGEILYVIPNKQISIVVNPDTTKPETIIEFTYTIYHNTSLTLFPTKVHKGERPIHYGYQYKFETEKMLEYFLKKYFTIREISSNKGIENIKLVEVRNEFELSEREQEQLHEGAKKTIVVNAYERNGRARRACLEYYGSKCILCGFDSREAYGEEFEGMIHVHHIKPLNEIGSEYVVDSIKDLIPVCPNCHMILHSKKNIQKYIDKIREITQIKK